ncbi:MAG: BatD family protein [Bdellovibrio sp.]
MTRIGNYLCFLILWGGTLAQAATTVQSSVDRNEMGLGDTFTLSVSVISTEEVEIQDPRVPDIDGFELLNNWQSTAVAQKLVNTPQGMKFETQRRREFQYQLSPRRVGNLSVSSFEVVVDGKVYHTKPILIKVGSEPTRNARPSRPQVPGFEDPFDSMDQEEEDIFNQLLRQRQRLLQQQLGQMGRQEEPPAVRGLPQAAFRSLPTNANEAFFISVEVDKTEVYEGEQVTTNWYIYTRGQMETLDRLKFPSLRGFWKEIIEEVPSIQFSEEIVNGIPWKKALLASHALFPIKAGTAVIDEYKIKSRVRLPSQTLGGFYGRPYEYTKSSARVPIKVKPLPVEGRPQDFTGAVGQFEVHASIENTSVPANQPLSLKVRFEGAGNAKVIDLPAISWPVGLEQYDSKSESKYFKNGRSYKEFEVLLIPRQEGEMLIPGLSVSMFDPQSGKYYTRTTQPLTLNVLNNPNAPVGSSSRVGEPAGGKAPAPVANQLPHPVTEWRTSAHSQILALPGLWGALYGLISLVLLWKAQREFGWGRRRRTLKELVHKRYKKVDDLLHKGDERAVGAEMLNIFYTVLGESSGTGGAAAEVERLLEAMPPSVRRDHGDELTKSFEYFQTLSFAPPEMLKALKGSDSVKSQIAQAKKVLNSVIAAVSEK